MSRAYQGVVVPVMGGSRAVAANDVSSGQASGAFGQPVGSHAQQPQTSSGQWPCSSSSPDGRGADRVDGDDAARSSGIAQSYDDPPPIGFHPLFQWNSAEQQKAPQIKPR